MRNYALALLFGFTACASAGSQAIKTCELNALPQTLQGVVGCVATALASQGDWRSEVQTCGEGLLPSQLNCVVSALVTGGNSGPPRLSLVTVRGQLWLNEHKVATPAMCTPSVQ